MSTRVRSVLLCLILVALCALPAGFVSAAPTTPTASDAALAQLRADAGGEVQVSIKRGTGVAGFVRLPEAGLAETANAESVAADPEARARGFLAQYGALFGIRDQAAELAQREVSTDAAGNTHVIFRQVHGGLSVFGGDLRVHMNAAGRVTSAGGAFIPDVAVATKGAITQAQAEQTALAEVAAANPDATAALAAVQTELLVYRTGLVQGVAGENHLAYRVEAGDGDQVREQVFIDAMTGKTLDRFSMIADALYRELYNRAMGSRNLVWKEGDAWPSDTEYQDVLNGAAEAYNVIGSLTNGGWLSYNGADAVMKSIANYREAGYCPNASWTGTNTQFCTDVSGDDTVAHEWGHAYTEYTHNLVYAWQPGALNESYSDVWGEIADLLNGRGIDTPSGLRSADGSSCSLAGCGTNSSQPKTDTSVRWVSGEDDPGFGCPIRDMWRPECYDNPGKVSSTSYYCSSADGGGVHTNSGVPNHAFALLVDGGTYNGQTVTGIGITKAAHIYWQAQRFYQTNTTDFADHADSLELACADLVGQPLYDLKTTGPATWGSTTPAITTNDCAQLSKVALAVEMRATPNCNFAPMFNPNTPALCATGEPQNHLFQNFEAGLGAWTTQQTPSNAATWTNRPWTVVTDAPDDRPGSVVFGPNPVVGDCSADLENGVTSLLSPAVTIPANAVAPVKMAWDHLVSIEIDYDGGNLKASVNGGAFALVPASAFTFNPYNDTLATSDNDNPMAGQAAWSGGDGGALSSKWGQSQLDLSQIGVDPGDTVQFRWDLGSDGCNGWDGWYMDDVRVYSCVACATPNAPTGLGIAKANATTVNLNWTASGASQYEVWSAENAPFFDITGKTCANPAPYACAMTSSATYSPADLGDASVNHSYVVRGANSCGQTSATTNRVGEFEFGLVAGN